MRLNIADIDDAVLRIFAAHPEGAQTTLALEVLRRQWPRTCLRRGDLPAAIKRLIYGGLLQIASRDGPELRLTAVGLARLRALPPARGVWRRRLAKLFTAEAGDEALLRARRRRRSDAAAP